MEEDGDADPTGESGPADPAECLLCMEFNTLFPIQNTSPDEPSASDSPVVSVCHRCTLLMHPACFELWCTRAEYNMHYKTKRLAARGDE